MKRVFVTAAALSFLVACNSGDNSDSGASGDTSTTDMNNATGTTMDTTGNAAGSGMSTGMDTSMRTNNLGGTDTMQGSGSSTTNGSGSSTGTSGSSSGSTTPGSGRWRFRCRFWWQRRWLKHIRFWRRQQFRHARFQLGFQQFRFGWLTPWRWWRIVRAAQPCCLYAVYSWFLPMIPKSSTDTCCKSVYNTFRAASESSLLFSVCRYFR